MRKIALIGLAAAVAGIVGALALAAGPDRPDTPATTELPSVAAASPGTGASAANDAHLRWSVRQLRRDVAELRDLRAAPTTAEANENSTDGDGPRTTAMSIEDRAAAARAAELQYVAELDARLANELRDPAWAADTEREFTAQFADGRIQGGTLVGTRCGSTLCRVEVAPTGARDPESLVARVIDSRGPFTAGGHYSLDDDTGHMRFYVWRPGNRNH